MVFGIGFHLAIGYMMSIETFSIAMISSYLLFLDPETLPRLCHLVQSRFGGPPLLARPEKRRRVPG